MFENVLSEEKIVLSGPERRRLFEQIVAEILSLAPRESDGIDRLAAILASLQKADGSFDGDPVRTALALICWVLLGHTRRKGVRKRAVTKVVKWLESHRDVPEVALALDLLRRAEEGDTPAQLIKGKKSALRKLMDADPDLGEKLGRILAYVIAAQS
jgi:hypothetical protein